MININLILGIHRYEYTLETGKQAKTLDRSTLPVDTLRAVDFDIFNKSCTCTFANGKKASFELNERDFQSLTLGNKEMPKARAIDAVARIVYPRLKEGVLKTSYLEALASVAKEKKKEASQYPWTIPSLLESKKSEMHTAFDNLLKMDARIERYSALVKKYAPQLDPKNPGSISDLKGFFRCLASIEDNIALLSAHNTEGSLHGQKAKQNTFKNPSCYLSSQGDHATYPIV